jgi:hypothetical protein
LSELSFFAPVESSKFKNFIFIFLQSSHMNLFTSIGNPVIPPRNHGAEK